MTDEELIARLRNPNVRVWADGVAAADRIEQLTEQLAAARRDAETAEEELELQEEEACMMENSYLELEMELNTCRMAQAVMDNTVADLEAKLAKAVEALEPLAAIADAFDANELDDEARKFWGQHSVNTTPHEDIELYQGRGGKQLLTLADCMFARATLAEIKGESHD